ncbi:MAG: DUF4180 domain-containing protein [Peptococcaceae bacterium]|nr:DUF4180 domain-containing protein [Peptococcaceae bacterium]
MSIEKINAYIASITGNKPLITDTDSALDLMINARYETGVSCFIIEKEIFCNEFFILSSGLAGEILQKLVNYQFKIAIIGDFSVYSSKPLLDFIFESNQGHDVFFVTTMEEALKKLKKCNE